MFGGSIPQLYDQYIVPLIFEPYARDLARRLASRRLSRVLEIACGTGAVTRQLASTLPASVEIVATDLNQSMLDVATANGTARHLEWRQADAMQLPFDGESFDAVVCQFGVMFFPDKARAFAGVRRVLQPGGIFLCNVWDRIEVNEFADEITKAVGKNFLARTPHGYHDVNVVARDVSAGGFKRPMIETIAERSRAASARDPAIAYVHGTPLRDEVSNVDEATDVATEAIARRFGRGPVDGKIQAHIVSMTK